MLVRTLFEHDGKYFTMKVVERKHTGRFAKLVDIINPRAIVRITLKQPCQKCFNNVLHSLFAENNIEGPSIYLWSSPYGKDAPEFSMIELETSQHAVLSKRKIKMLRRQIAHGFADRSDHHRNPTVA